MLNPLRRTGLSATVSTLVAVSTMALALEAQAQDRPVLTQAPIDLQTFRPAIDSKGFITLNSSQLLWAGDLSFGLVLNWGRRPLELEGQATLAGEPTATSFRVEHILTPSFQAAVGVFNRGHFGLSIGAVLPLHILFGEGLPSDPGPDATTVNDNRDFRFSAQGMGDLMVSPKIRLLSAGRGGLGLAVLPSVIFPTGNEDKFLGEGQIIFQPTVVLDTEAGRLGRFRAGINAGARLRGEEREFRDTTASYPRTVFAGGGPVNVNTNEGIRVKNELLFGAGLSFGVVPQRFDLVGEVIGHYGPDSRKLLADGTEENLGAGLEGLAGIKLYLARNSFFMAGGGYRFTRSYGAAAPRMFVGFIFEPSIGDRDGDGIKDDVDRCPDDPEDYDDFEDEDGCPDPDNDRDGIPDVDDRCPNDPENFNGFQDEDGCPDRTANDRDGDGIPDDQDKCPDDPEDFDGFEDEDGCPDPDNDRDGIPDVADLCPNDPEDFDGFEDQDGCPDPDNDRDRIPDVSDRCPNEPETYNGFEDEDGCPDKGKVIVRKGKLEILDKIYFETNRYEVKPVSFPLLDAIAATINGNPQLELLEIQGHADERGSDDHNLQLTEGRSQEVRKQLVQRGVDPVRLQARGYGESRPVCRESNEPCWSKNRRVEFIILKRSDE